MTNTAVRRSATWLVDQMDQTRAGVKALAQPQLGSSSIEQGAIEEYDAEGTLVSTVGTQFDSTHTAVSLAGPPPPVPSQPTLTPGPGQVQVRWNGLFDDDAISPMDFSHVSVHMSLEEAFDPDNDTQVATIRGESGDSVTVLRETGEWWVSLVAVSQSGKWSEPSEPVLVEVPDVVTIEVFQDARIDLDDQIDAVRQSADGKTTIFASTSAPTDEVASVGDRWEVWTTLEPGGKLLQTWRYAADGTWVLQALDATYIPLLDIGSGTFGQLSGSRLLVNSVKADALEAVLVLVTNIVAGDPNGTHARMGPDGFTVWASPDGVSAPVVVVKMGVGATDDYFSIMRADGSIAASISSTGEVSAQTISGRAFTLDGIDLQTEILAPMPKGIYGGVRAGRATNSLYWAGTTPQPYLQLDFDADEGRMYEVSTTPIGMDSDVGGIDAVVNLHYKTGGGACETSDTIIASGQSVQGSASTRRSPVTLNRPITPPAGPVSLLLSYGTVSAGRAKIVASGGRSVFLYVKDMGAAPPDVGVSRDGTGDAATGGSGGGSGTGAPAPKNYDRTWNATGIRSFTGSGSRYDYRPEFMFSGLSPAGYGDLSSMAVFPDFTSTLAGATINEVWVYVYYDGWYYSAGGSAYFGLHGQTALTGSAPAKTYAHALSANWPRPGGRWVKLSTSTYAGFKSGQHRGFTLGGSGGGYERYGYAHDPKIRIKYTK